jgi:hypothetical protein
MYEVLSKKADFCNHGATVGTSAKLAARADDLGVCIVCIEPPNFMARQQQH